MGVMRTSRQEKGYCQRDGEVPSDDKGEASPASSTASLRPLVALDQHGTAIEAFLMAPIDCGVLGSRKRPIAPFGRSCYDPRPGTLLKIPEPSICAAARRVRERIRVVRVG